MLAKKKVLEMKERAIPCKQRESIVSGVVLKACSGHKETVDVHKTLRMFKNPLQAAAENVHVVRGLEPPCYLVLG